MLKRFLIFLADIIGFYASLILTLMVRYQTFQIGQNLRLNFWPFSLILILWLVIFYGSRLYDLRQLKNTTDFFLTYQKAFIIAFIISIIFFYIFGVTFNQITPKTNLVIFVLIYEAIFSLIRFQINQELQKSIVEKILFVIEKENEEFLQIKKFLEANPQLGYHFRILKINHDKNPDLEEALSDKEIKTIIFSNVNSQADLTQIVLSGYEVFDLKDFYEKIFGKVKVENEAEFISMISKRKNPFYEALKRLIDVLICFTVGYILLPILFPFIALAVKLNSAGPIFYKEKRVGKGGEAFTVYKFRTMIHNAKEVGPAWTVANDPRITKVGKFLRWLHLDEWPQAWSVITNKMSLVGPRAESIDIFEKAQTALPLIKLRHLIKPGVTGWAQINYKPSASMQELKEKLEYDLYYIKNRSLIMDLAIILKTLRQVI